MEKYVSHKYGYIFIFIFILCACAMFLNVAMADTIPSEGCINISEMQISDLLDYSTDQNTKGQYFDETGSVISFTGWSTTCLLEVESDKYITIGGLDKTESASAPRSIFLDPDGKVIKSFKLKNGRVHIPKGAKYFAASIANYDAETIEMLPVYDGIMHQEGGGAQFSLVNKKLFCTIIDDDTMNSEAVERFYAACEAQGIKGTLACLTLHFDTDPDLSATLHNMVKKGYQVILHAHSQEAGKWTMKTNSDGIAICDSLIDELEADVVQGMYELQKEGFTNWNYWAVPGGVDTALIQRIARKLGFRCMFTTKNDYNTIDNKYSRYDLHRCALNPSDDMGTFTIQELKEMAEKAKQDNGWLIIMTHFAEWKDNDFSRFNEAIDFIRDLGYEFVTVGEAWSYYEPVYCYWEVQ